MVTVQALSTCAINLSCAAAAMLLPRSAGWPCGNHRGAAAHLGSAKAEDVALVHSRLRIVAAAPSRV